MHRGLVEPEAVRRLVLAELGPLPPRPVPLPEVHGLVLAEPVEAPFDLPRFDNSAMDGFAVRSTDTACPPTLLRVVGRSLAGVPSDLSIGPGEAVAIATGAMMPDGADAVAPLEEVEVDGADLVVRAPVPSGRHVRRAGEDVSVGRVVLRPGTVLGPGQLAAAASLGLPQLVVHPRPRVAIIPTGDEVRPAGSLLEQGEIYDAVSVPLAALVGQIEAVARVQPPAPDRPRALMGALRRASQHVDALITVGGVSVGERDFISALSGPVAVRTFRVALRPARPFAFGRAYGKPLFALPGNPASALAAFEEFVRPGILALLGKPPELRPAVQAVLSEALLQQPGTLHLVRATVWCDGDCLRARVAGSQGAGMIHSLAAANAWAVIPADVASLPAGSEIDVRMLGEPFPSDP